MADSTILPEGQRFHPEQRVLIEGVVKSDLGGKVVEVWTEAFVHRTKVHPMEQSFDDAEISWAVDEMHGAFQGRHSEFCVTSDNCTCDADAEKIEAILRSKATVQAEGSESRCEWNTLTMFVRFVQDGWNIGEAAEKAGIVGF